MHKERMTALLHLSREGGKSSMIFCTFSERSSILFFVHSLFPIKSVSQFKLIFYQFVVDTLVVYKCIMSPHFDHLSSIKHDNLICIFYRTQPVRYYYYSASLIETG